MRAALLFFCLLAGLGIWSVASGWRAREQSSATGREVQTLLSAQFIQQDNDFSPAYPTPVLGRPWSIPVEFPLYQWTAVVLSNLTGHELAGTGRVLGLLCFYLALPALFLAVRDSGLTPTGSLIGLGLLAGNPFCLNQAAAFQWDGMAVMFGAWFLAGVMRGLTTGRRVWFGLAILAGAAAGAIHARTLGVFHLLVLGGSGFWLWRRRGGAFSWAAGAWWLAAGLLPWAAAGGWMHHAAGIRQLNANVQHLPAIGMTGPDFLGAPSSTDLMGRQLSLIGAQAVWWPLLLIGAALAITFSERWWRQVGVWTAAFFVWLLLFPPAGGPHLHEAMAGLVCLLVALGLALAGLFDAALPRWAGPAGLLVFGALGAIQVHRAPPVPRSPSPLEQLGQALQQAVLSDAYLVTQAAPDTGLQLPLAAQRRTLNLTQAQMENEAELQAALTAMGNEPLGAVVLNENTAPPADRVTRIAQQAGLELQRVFTYREWIVYLPKHVVRPALDQLLLGGLPEIVLAAEMLPAADALAGDWKEMGKLWGFQRAIFRYMQPRPVSFYSSFGPSVMGDDNGEEWFNAHPTTRLRFQLPPGEHRLQTRVMMQPGTFDPALPPAELSDGVEFQLAAVGADDDRKVLHTRLIDPARNAADREPQPIDLRFTLPAETELEISFGPGPARRTNRDWVYLGRLRID